MCSYFSEEENKNIDNNNNISEKSFCEKIKIYLNSINDKIIIYRAQRWGAVAILATIYFIRVFRLKGYYALTYCIGIHFLNSFIGFISPLDDPEEELGVDNSYLPQRSNEEFRPFQRKVKEFSFWNMMFWTFLFAIFFTFFDAFNIPVFWPLLLVYFLLIFFLIMKRQIKHMIKYHYLPWDTGKKNYATGRVPSQK